MTLLRHIRACNAHDPALFVPLVRRDPAGWTGRLGFIRLDNIQHLARFPEVFALRDDAVDLVAAGDADAITAAVDRVVEALIGDGQIPKWRRELFDVATSWGGPPVFRLNRGAVGFFGVRAFGVHMNGYRRDGDGLKLWVGRRARDKKVEPGKLDNLVAGGVSSGHGLYETLVKEAGEEAALPKVLMAKALAVGAVTYRMQIGNGIRDDALVLYDLEIPPEIEPRNTDGEIEEFHLMSAEAVIDRVRGTDEFKFNVNLVLIDFAIRHGLIDADEPDYLALVAGLRRAVED